AEHVADIDMPAVDHDLDAVGTTALIAVGQVPDAASEALRRNRRVRDGPRGPRQARRGGQSQQPLHMFAASDGRHGREVSQTRAFRADGSSLAYTLLAGLARARGRARNYGGHHTRHDRRLPDPETNRS